MFFRPAYTGRCPYTRNLRHRFLYCTEKKTKIENDMFFGSVQVFQIQVCNFERPVLNLWDYQSNFFPFRREFLKKLPVKIKKKGEISLFTKKLRFFNVFLKNSLLTYI